MAIESEQKIEPTDALTDVLKAIRLTAKTYFCSDFDSPWAMEMVQSNKCMFHVVVSGQCWVKTMQREALICLGAGDIIAFPTGAEHWMGDAVDSQVAQGSKVVEGILTGHHPFQTADKVSNESVLLMCGSFSYDSSFDHPFIKDLPDYIHIKSASSTPAWLGLLVGALSNESRNPSPGSTVVVDRLSEVLFIQLMRAYVSEAPDRMRYMSALLDPQIGKALNMIHAEEIAQLTVKNLGESVALSRTVFTERFAKLVGIPPKTYLINWRMQRAKVTLQSGKATMISIAERAGYASEAAFGKAFKQFFNVTPGRIRREEEG
jgi:AraC-like DNA-binding protein